MARDLREDFTYFRSGKFTSLIYSATVAEQSMEGPQQICQTYGQLCKGPRCRWTGTIRGPALAAWNIKTVTRTLATRWWKEIDMTSDKHLRL